MAITSGIVKNITSDRTTQPVGGLEVTAYLCNRLELSPTYDATSPNKVTALSIATGKVMYKLKGVSKNLNAKHERVMSDDLADEFKHTFSFKGFEFDSPSVLNIDGLSDVCVFVVYKNKTTTGDGVIVGYGLKCGLYVTSDTREANASNSIRVLEMASKDQQTEPFSQYNVLITDYVTTLARLEELLTNA